VLDKGQEDDWFASAFISDLSIVAAVSLIAFVIWELRRADPIVDLRLLADRNFALGNLLMFMLGLILLASTTLLPLFVQTMLGYTATDAGLVISPGGFALLLMMPLVGVLATKLDARFLITLRLCRQRPCAVFDDPLRRRYRLRHDSLGAGLSIARARSTVYSDQHGRLDRRTE
jgi:DHA2 family multidrug resistance protein